MCAFRFFRKRWPLDSVLFSLSRKDPFTLANAVEGSFICGATGSGKTSGSGRALAVSFLKAGFGGLVLTSKVDELGLWKQYCRESGRSRDLIVFGPSQKYRFNFLDFELNRASQGAGLTENIVNLFSEVLQIAERQSGQGGREDEGYWRRACRQLCRNAVDVLAMSEGRISIPALYKLVVSAPNSLEEVNDDRWKARSFCFQSLRKADQRPKKSARQKLDFEIAADYWLVEYPALSSKTRSIVVSTFTGMIDVLNRSTLAELFCGETNITPEAIEKGKIILVDLPVKYYAEVGVFAQVLWKYCFQRSIERRDLRRNERPVFLFGDEFQHFVTSYDMQFQTTCRAARVATVVMTQSLSVFYAALGGGEKGKAESHALVGNLNSKFFHANGDPVTNEFAASVIGRSRKFLTNSSSSQQPVHPFSEMLGLAFAPTLNAGMSETLDFEVQPQRFTTLAKGGRASRYQVEGILFQGGRHFRQTGRTWLPVTFRQK